MHLSSFAIGFLCCFLIGDLTDALSCRSEGGPRLSELKNIMMDCVKKHSKMMNTNSARGSQYEQRRDGKVHANNANERNGWGSGTGMEEEDRVNMGKMNSNQYNNQGNNNKRSKRQSRRDMTTSLQNSNQKDQYNPLSNHRDNSYMTSSGSNDPFSSNSFGSSSSGYGSSSDPFGSSSDPFDSPSNSFGSSSHGYSSSSDPFGSSSNSFGRSSNPYISSSYPYEVKNEYNSERNNYGFGQGETGFQDKYDSGNRGDRFPLRENGNQYKSYNNGKNNEDDMRMNMSFSLKDLKNHECIIHCFLENLDMTEKNGMPDKYMVTQKLMKDVHGEDLKDFLQESVEECFQLLNNDKLLDKCQFSKNLMTCLTEKGKANCDDWDVESFDN